MSQFSQDAVSFFVADQLTAQATRIYDEQLPPLTADQIVPPTGGEFRGANKVAKEVMQGYGRAAWVADAADDLPRVNVGVIRDEYNIDMAGCCYGYTIKEIHNAIFANRNLEVARASRGRRAIEEFRNSIFFYGSVAKQIFGLLSLPYIPRGVVSASDFQAGADPEDTLQALYSLSAMALANSQYSVGAEPTHLLLPPSIYNYIAQTRASTLTQETILAVYQRNAAASQAAPNVLRVPELENAGVNGGPVVAAINARGDAVEHLVPLPLEILPPQPRNLETVVNMVCEIGGFVTEFPMNHFIAEAE